MTARILLTQPADAPRQTLDAYRAAGGYAAWDRVREGQITPSELLAEVEAAELRGRGGASFPAARKWAIAAAEGGAPKCVVANGGEHEPGSEKDKHLVAKYPHAVLEGILLCAHATGAQNAFLYLIEDMLPQIEAAEAALEEARAADLLPFEIAIHRAPTTYVAGEETAAIDSIEGGPGKPREKPPYPGVSGVGGKPTTVNNVETLAHVPFIVRQGAAAYRAIGVEGSRGTMLFTLGDEVERPGVYELPFGATYRELIEGYGGGVVGGRAVRAVLPAMSSGFLAAEHLDVPIAHATLQELGTSPGCGGVRLILDGDDVLERLEGIAQFFMDEQCGQCPPCRMETNQLVHVLKGVRAAKGPGYAEQIEKITAFARGKGRCSLIEMAAAPIRSAVEVFAEDFAAAAAGGGGS